MRLIGITGSIGSGKSTFAPILAGLQHYLGNNIFCVDADDLAKDAVAKGSKGLSQITQAFGSQILTPDYELDRKKLAHIAFNDPEKLKQLNAIVHPEVNRLRKLAFETCYQEEPEFTIFYIVPLLFENQLQRFLQKVVLVTVTPEIQMKRLTEKRGFTQEEAAARIKNQMPQSEKEKKADFLIDNNSHIINLRVQAEALHPKIMSLPQLGPEAMVF